MGLRLQQNLYLPNKQTFNFNCLCPEAFIIVNVVVVVVVVVVVDVGNF